MSSTKTMVPQYGKVGVYGRSVVTDVSRVANSGELCFVTRAAKVLGGFLKVTNERGDSSNSERT